MRVYIAAPFFNPEQLSQVVAIENLLLEKRISFFSPRNFGVIQDMTPEEKEREMKNIYDKNVEKLLWCDTAVVLIDHKDTGTTWELGFLAGLNHEDFSDSPRKKIVTVSLENKPVNVMLRYCIDAHASNLESLVQILLKIEGGWKDINEEKMPEVNE